MGIGTGLSVEVEVDAQVSHDIRNAVAAMRLLVEAVRDGVVEARPGSGTVDQMLVQIRLLVALLDVQRDGRERRQGAGPARAVDVALLLEEWTEAMRLKAAGQGVELLLVVDDNLPLIACRRDEISRVLLNLIGNAIRHTPANGIVDVRAIGHPGGVQVQINDTGPGLSRRARAALDAVAPTAPGGGAGHGFAIARRVVKAHGGALWAGKPACGASVRFTLPAFVVADPIVRRPAAESPGEQLIA